MGGGGVEMLDDFSHDDDIVGRDRGPGGRVGSAVQVEVNVLAAQLAGEAVIEVAESIDDGGGEGFLEKQGLMG